MHGTVNKRWGHWALPAQTQTAGTVIYQGVPPYRGPASSAPFLYAARADGGANWYGQPVTKVTYAVITSGATLHTWTFLRPKNWATIGEAVTKNDTTVVMATNPGLYATTYKYPLPAGVTAPGVVADNTPASGDYCCFQMDNGVWHFSLISSLSSLTLTIATATPNVDGSTSAVGRVLFFFAAAADKDPATGYTDPSLQPVVSATTHYNHEHGFVSGLHGGDPLVLLNANGTNASTLEALAGAYDTY